MKNLESILKSRNITLLTKVHRVQGVEGVVAQSCPTFATPWTVAYQASPSMGFSRQEYWIGLPFPSPGDLHDPGIEPGSPAFEADALPSEPPGKPLSYGFSSSHVWMQELDHKEGLVTKS